MGVAGGGGVCRGGGEGERPAAAYKIPNHRGCSRCMSQPLRTHPSGSATVRRPRESSRAALTFSLHGECVGGVKAPICAGWVEDGHGWPRPFHIVHGVSSYLQSNCPVQHQAAPSSITCLHVS